MRPPSARGTDCVVAPAPLRLRGCDEGFSFVELLVALSLLLITLVAVMGLSTTSSFMAGAARQRAAMVNAGAGYLERVREEPFVTVGTPSRTPTGDLVAVVTISTPYVITVTPSVSWGRPEEPTNHAFKTVTLSVVSSLARGGSQMTYRTSAVVADVGTVANAGGLRSSMRPAGLAPLSSGVVRENAAWGLSASLDAWAGSSSRSAPRGPVGQCPGGPVPSADAARTGARRRVTA